jgi:cation:H+ antiporter
MDGLWMHIFLLVVGFVVLVKSADWLVDGATALARRFGVSELAIGLTVVAFGTSMPELVVSTISAFKGSADVAFGNVIGSNSFNILFILGVAGIIYPLACQNSTIKFEIPFSLFCILLLAVLVNDKLIFGAEKDQLSVADGGIIFIFFLGFLYYVYKTMKADDVKEEHKQDHTASWKIALFIVLGLAGLILGGDLVVENAVEIARGFGVSEKLIGLTIIAGGTSLPELAASSVAAYRKNADIAVGNIVGSNIFNILCILSITSFLSGGNLNYDAVMNFDIGMVCVATVMLLIFMFSGSKAKIDRFEAVLFLLVYLGYTYYLISRG